MAADDKITDVLSEHTSLEKIQNGQKLKCALSGHEMPCRLDAINTYITGKKYKKLKAKSDQDKEDYMQHLEQKKGKKAKFGHSIYCKLTCRSLSDQPLHIKRHVEGRRFQKALARWKECQKTGEKFVPRQPMKRDAAMETDDRSSDGADRSSDGDDRPSDGDDRSSEVEDEDEDAMGEDEDSMDDYDMDEDDGAMSDLYPSSDSEPADVEMITKGRARVTPQKADDQESEASDFDFDEIYRNAPVATQETDSEEEEEDSEGEDEPKDEEEEEEEDDAEEAEAEEGSEESEEEKQELKPGPSKRKLKRMQFKMNKKARMAKKKKAQS